MPASLSWLDHSEYDRRRAVEVIKLFEEKGTVDELGIGVVRDAISDSLFPGTSVLHPRARYFLIVPWVYRRLESKRIPSAEIAARARQMELALIEQIIASDDNQSVIGRIARKRLKVLPSAMYWSGLEAWGVRLATGTQWQYHRSLDKLYRSLDTTIRDDDNEAVTPIRRTWHGGLPAAPAGFGRESLSLSLTREEAEYLHERIMTRCRGSLLAHLVDRCAPAPDSEYVWQHPQQADFSAEHKGQVEHARNFSQTMQGAALLYNLMLAEKKAEAEYIERYREMFAGWAAEIDASGADLAAWDRTDFWRRIMQAGARVTPATRTFIDHWLNGALNGQTAGLRDSKPIRSVITLREKQLKGKLARLDNPAALKLWRGASGVNRISYRWDPQIRQVTTDIQRGLSRHA